ncbi:hypothetical protein EVAR_90773_1 [Eumeta japonica]|uniref:Uncharacterized protein n=1 Tax=Eumeta variegata TaxID=151549 RepID=A0A4C1YJX5_EUMVA|nr:hypothetical protein EVAR_90773_1 [Eumeta japonica]
MLSAASQPPDVNRLSHVICNIKIRPTPRLEIDLLPLPPFISLLDRRRLRFISQVSSAKRKSVVLHSVAGLHGYATRDELLLRLAAVAFLRSCQAHRAFFRRFLTSLATGS